MTLLDILILVTLGVWFAVVIAFMVRRHIRNKRTGQISCCCSCSSCQMSGKCGEKK